MGLTNIEYGSLASSEIINNNYNYLDNRISEIANTEATNFASLNSNIASINTSINSKNEQNQKEFTSIKDKLDQNSKLFSQIGAYVTYYRNGSSWYKEYFSDEGKKNRIGIEQGGICHSRSTTTYLKAFKDTNYTILLGTHNLNFEHGGISAKNQTNFSFYDGKGRSYNVEWFACGE